MLFSARLQNGQHDHNFIILRTAKTACEAGSYWLQAGLRKMRAEVIFQYTYKGENCIVLSREAASELLMPEVSCINVKIANDCIELGPFLGILISDQKIERLLAGDWDSVYWRFQQWVDELGGIVFFFSPGGINWHDNLVTGYRWNEKKEWMAGKYPLPKVIYDRCFGHTGRAQAILLRQRLKQLNLPVVVYNAVAKFGKYDVYEHLSKYQELVPHLPFYAWYEPSLLLSLLDRGHTVYLKPNRLYKGYGVIRVSRTEAGYTLEWRQEQNRVVAFREAEVFLQQLEAEMAAGQKYLMQLGIDLATFLGNRFDLRVMLHKTAPDRWTVTGINARIAPVASVVTSPRSGGNVIYASAALAHAFPGREKDLMKKIKSFACALGRALEEGFGFLGELGVDLGLDRSGRLYLIEVNAKPLKVSFSRIKDKAVNKVINRTPVILGCILAGFDFSREIAYKSAGTDDVFLFKFLPYGPGWPKRMLFLHDGQLEFFGYRPGQFVTLQVGFSKTSVEIGRLEKQSEAKALYLSPQLYRELSLRQPFALLAWSQTHLVFGPVVAMSVSDDTYRFLAEDEELLTSALLAWEKGVLFYAFRPDRVDWEQEKAEAYVYDPVCDSWQERKLPFPQILYDLATYPFNLNKRRLAKEANRKLRQDYELQPINTKRFFGKWQTYNELKFFRDLQPHLPVTAELTKKSLQNFTAYFPFCYVKSNYGSFGEDVLRIEKNADGYLCSGGGREISAWHFSSLEAAYDFLVNRLHGQLIIQEGINLAQMDGRIFDMRVLVQKNARGQWVVSSIDFRIAQKGAVVTNTALGADEIIVGQNDPFPHPGSSWREVEKFSLKVALALEACFGLHGEIGLDVALDQEGKLWLIEANSKPNTRGYKEVVSPEISSLIYGLPLDYAKFLARRMYVPADL